MMRFLARLFFSWCLVVWSTCAFPLLADERGRGEQELGAVPEHQLKLDRFPNVLARNLTSNLLTRKNVLPFVVGAVSSLAVAPADQEISDSLRGHAHEFGNTGQVFNAGITASLAGGTLLVSRLTTNERFRSFGYTLAQAYVTDLILTQGIKYTSHRMRPDGSSSTAFPSGHTADAFAMATVLSSYYGKKWGIPFYAAASLVGISRIEKGRHWPSDVVAGAAIGYISGLTAIRGARRELSGGLVSRVAVLPVYGRTSRGVTIRFR